MNIIERMEYCIEKGVGLTVNPLALRQLYGTISNMALELARERQEKEVLLNLVQQYQGDNDGTDQSDSEGTADESGGAPPVQEAAA